MLEILLYLFFNPPLPLTLSAQCDLTPQHLFDAFIPPLPHHSGSLSLLTPDQEQEAVREEGSPKSFIWTVWI